MRIRTRRGKPGGGGALDLSLGLVQCGIQGTNRLDAPAVFVMLTKVFNLPDRARRVANQPREVAPCRRPAVGLASRRAIASRSP